MANGPRYSVKFRRRRQNKTNYAKRFNILKSGKPRLVVRKTNQRFIAQIINYSRNGDVTKVNCTSSELIKYGWKHNIKNRPAAYLTGYLLAKKAQKNKINEAVIDFGLYTLTKGNKLFAFIKGVSDFGSLTLNYDQKIFPSDELLSKVSGKDLSKDIDSVKNKINSEKVK